MSSVGIVFRKEIREILRLPWSSSDERKLRAFSRLVARTMPRVPERLRYLPIAYQARRAARRATNERAA